MRSSAGPASVRPRIVGRSALSVCLLSHMLFFSRHCFVSRSARHVFTRLSSCPVSLDLVPDVNECATANGGCFASSRCTNRVGGFHCNAYVLPGTLASL